MTVAVASYGDGFALRELPILGPRWTTLRRHEVQQAYYWSPYRFNVVPAGRRSGKTELAKRKLVRRALEGSYEGRFFAAAPTRDQAKRIYWNDLKKLVPKRFWLHEPSESELFIKLVHGPEIWVLGMDKPERIEGSPWDGGILDEFGNMKAKAWGENVRPALSDRKGWCDLIGVPEGRNHYYDAAQKAKAQMIAEAANSSWGYFHWKSADILDPEEIREARENLDPLTYEQEYEGSFINFEGRAYYTFSDLNLARLEYDPSKPLVLCFDFNVAPGVAAICQEQKLPNGRQGTGVIGEVWIERNSNTEIVAKKILTDWGEHQGQVWLEGDSTGGNSGTAKLAGSDWDIIKQVLMPKFGARLFDKVPKSNPPERTRVNAVNSRIRNGAGEVRLMVDPAKAPHVVKDFEGVPLVKGGSGEIDKKADEKLTHISDAIGYYIARQFPLTPQTFSTLKIHGA